MWKKASFEDLYIGAKVIQYLGDKLVLLVEYIDDDYIYCKYEREPLFGLKFPVKKLGSEFCILYINDYQLSLFDL